jgi:hypothetical protein
VNVEAQIRAVFESVLTDLTPWKHPNAPIVILKTKGRCVHVGLSGAPRWCDLAADLLGAGRPCEEFRLIGRDLYARMKTPEQLAADDAALEYDETHEELHTWGGFENIAEEKAAKSKPKKDIRGKWEKLLEEFIRETGESRFVRLALLEDARDALKKKGHEIRLDNLNRELKKLVGRVLEPDGEDEYTLKEDDA